MSRRLVIAILAVLIIGVVGGTIVVILSRLRSDATPTPTTTPGTLTEAPTGEQTVIDPTGDDDSDGLPNSDEALWGTNRTNPDTDGDGFRDGEEVTAGHNPTIPSPNDKLPPGFTPGREVTPLNPASNQPVAVDQFFVAGLNLNPIGNTRNLSNEFQSRFSEQERTPNNLKQFIAEQPIVSQLPQPNEQAIKIGSDNSVEAIANYLRVAGDLDALNNKYLMGETINDMLAGRDSGGALTLALSVDIYQENLLELTVPPAAVNLHKLLLGYSELIKATFNQMAMWEGDELRGLLALRQLEVIDAQYYPLIRQEVVRLATGVLEQSQ